MQVADYADNISTYKINLNPDELSGDVSVKLNASSLTLYKKNTAKLVASVEPFGVQPDTVTWTSSNDAVATVSDNGLVTAIAEGTAVITATSDKDATKSASCTVTVSNVNTLIYGTLQDADGNAMIYKWDMSKNDTWSNYNDLEAGSAISATMDMDDNLWICDATSAFKIHKVDVATGKDIASYTNATEVPIWDMEYSYVFSADNDPKVFSIYAYYLLAPNSPTALTTAAFNMQSYMANYSGASYPGCPGLRRRQHRQRQYGRAGTDPGRCGLYLDVSGLRHRQGLRRKTQLLYLQPGRAGCEVRHRRERMQKLLHDPHHRGR